MKILFYLLTHSPWLLNHLTALCNILPCSVFFFFFFFFTSALLHLISTWFYSNPRGKFRFSEKARTSLKYPFFKTAVVKHFNHGQTVANQPKLFDFDTRRYKKYLTNFDGLTIIGVQYVYFPSKLFSQRQKRRGSVKTNVRV